MIEVRGLTKAYGRKKVLHDVSFTAPPGAVTGFLGPNGAGKTTSLRLMLGLEVGEGSTRFEGRRLTDWPVPATVVGAVVDANSFHPTVPIRQQLRALAAASGLDVRTRPDAVLESMGLADVARMAPRKLSLGMRQRLGLAAAILGDPRILVLDEPGNGLDAPAIHWLRGWLRGLAASGKTIFVCSHLLREMQSMADRVVVLNDGRVIADEPIGEFLHRGGVDAVKVETPDGSALRRAADRLGATVVSTAQADLYAVSGITRLELADALWQERVRVLALYCEERSLEDVYLQVAGSGNYEIAAAR